MSHIVYKKSSISDKFLKKTEIKARCIFRKIIQATKNLNNHFGMGKYSLSFLYERVNCYLNCDGHKSISLRTFDRYLHKLRLLDYQGVPLFVSLSRKLGENQGTAFSAEVSPYALYAINKHFFDLKMASVQKRKMASVKTQKMASDIVYIKNLFSSLLKKEKTELPVCQEAISQPQENQNSSPKSTSQPQKAQKIVSTEQISSSFSEFTRFSSGTQAYKQALRDLENMRIGEVALKEIERTLNHPIARENATLNLRDFLRDLGESKRESGINVYLQELKSLNGSMRLMRKGSQKYNTLLEETLNPKPKQATRRHSGVLLPSEQNVRFGIEPASQEEIQAIWKDFIERKKRVSTNTDKLDL